MHVSVCVHNLDYLTWSSSITWGYEYTWDTNIPMANSSSSNPAGIWSDPLQYSHTLIPLPHSTSWDRTLFSLSLCPLLSSSTHLYLTPTTHSFLTLPVIYPPVSQVACQHTGMRTQCWYPIGDGARALLRHRWFHTSLYKITYVLGVSWQMAVQWAIELSVLLPSSMEIPPGGI